METVDLEGAPDAEERARELLEEEATRPFDLAQGPVFRVRLVRITDSEHWLAMTVHHIACDGWSMGILENELMAFYRAGLVGEMPELPPLPVQYADFSEWQRGWLQGEVLEQELDFWRQRLEGLPPLLDLPTDRPRPPVASHRRRCGARS